jgi:hypothetical protein
MLNTDVTGNVMKNGSVGTESDRKEISKWKR